MQKFLINEFGQSLGVKIYSLQQKKLKEIIEGTTGKSNRQMKTLLITIIPKIALYYVLQETIDESKKAYCIVEKYMATIVVPKLTKLYSAFEFIPGYFYLFKRIMASTISKSDNWVSEIIQDDSFAIKFNITKCLWYDACVDNGCPELCKVFCDVDHVIYGSMKKVKFIREGTLGTGSKCCDFCYLNKGKQFF